MLVLRCEVAVPAGSYSCSLGRRWVGAFGGLSRSSPQPQLSEAGCYVNEMATAPRFW